MQVQIQLPTWACARQEQFPGWALKLELVGSAELAEVMEEPVGSAEVMGLVLAPVLGAGCKSNVRPYLEESEGNLQILSLLQWLDLPSRADMRCLRFRSRSSL